MQTGEPDVLEVLDRLGYAPRSEIGRGGMGVVYLAEQRSLRRLVAVKVLLPQDASDERLGRFRNEGRAFKELAHPHVVSVFDVGFERPLPYLVFEYIADATALSELIGMAVPARDAWRLLHEILQALEYLHARRIVHRDLKPGNVLIGADGAAKLIDLGLALALDADVTRYTRQGQFLGTPAYASPEQLRGEEATPAADVYAWALIAVEVLAGRRIFATSSVEGVPLPIRLLQGVPDIARFLPGLDPVAYGTLTRCLADDPRERPPDGGAVLAQMGSMMLAAATGEASAPKAVRVEAGPQARPAPSPPREVSRWSWLPGAAALAGALAVAALIPAGRAPAPVAPSPAMTHTAPPARAEPRHEVGLVVEDGAVTVAGAVDGESTLRVRWRERATDDEMTRTVSGPFKARVRAERIESLRIHLCGRVLECGPLLAPHALRLLEALDGVDWKSTKGPPAAARAELARMRPVLGLALSTVPEALQRRLFAHLWAMRDADEAAGEWGEMLAAPRQTAAAAQVTCTFAAPCVLTWSRAAGDAYVVIRAPGGATGLSVTLNGGVVIPFGRAAPAGPAVRARRVPAWAFRAGSNALEVRAAPGATPVTVSIEDAAALR